MCTFDITYPQCVAFSPLGLLVMVGIQPVKISSVGMMAVQI